MPLSAICSLFSTASSLGLNQLDPLSVIRGWFEGCKAPDCIRAINNDRHGISGLLFRAEGLCFVVISAANQRALTAVNGGPFP